ncbi:hypothetical protein D3C84_750250 [compost metagenome]
MQAGHAFLQGGHRGEAALRRPLRVLVDTPREPPGTRKAFEESAQGIGLVVADAQSLHRRAVHHVGVVGHPQEDDRMLGGYRVERQAIEELVVDQALAHGRVDPGARRRAGDRFLDPGADVLERGIGDGIDRQADAVGIRRVVHVRIVEARNDRTPLHIDDLGVGRCQFGHGRVATSRLHQASADRQRLAPGVIGIAGEDPSIEDEGIDAVAIPGPVLPGFRRALSLIEIMYGGGQK